MGRWEYCSLLWYNSPVDMDSVWTKFSITFISYDSNGANTEEIFHQRVPTPNDESFPKPPENQQSPTYAVWDMFWKREQDARVSFQDALAGTIAQLGLDGWEALSGDPATAWIRGCQGGMLFKRPLGAT
jgi:hypothetical protein